MLDVLQLGLTETRGLALYEMSAPRGLILQVGFPTRSASEISLGFGYTTHPYNFAPPHAFIITLVNIKDVLPSSSSL